MRPSALRAALLRAAGGRRRRPGRGLLVARTAAGPRRRRHPPATSTPTPDAGLPGRLVAEVTGDGAFRHLEELQRIADANRGNRALGTPGYDASVEYVARTLRDAGYTVDTPGVHRAVVLRAGRAPHRRRRRDRGDGARVLPRHPGRRVTAPLAVLAQDETSGCEAADFASVPAGAVVLVRRGTCPFGVKSTNAGGSAAAAVLVANNVDGPLDQATLGDVTGAVPTAGLSKADGDALAGRAGAAVNLVLATTIEERRSRNVVAQTTTGNPDNVVMAGAHLDSVPAGPGINDNGSGTAALLETAVRLGGAPPVANAVRFAFWGAEEEGLVGSTSYVAGSPTPTAKKIALYLNLDMVGSPNAGYLVYDGDNSDNEGAGPGPEGRPTIERVLLEQLATTRRDGRGHRLRRPLGLRPVHRRRHPGGRPVHRRRGAKTPEQAQRWGGTAGQPYDPCYHQACDRIDNDRPDGAGPQRRRRRRSRRALRAVHRRHPG